MARMKGSAIVGQISGMVGCVEFASGRSGQIVKAGRRSRGHATPREFDRAYVVGSLQGLWRAADEPFRRAWGAYAAQNSIKNTFGQSVNMSGLQAFFSYYTLLYDYLDRTLETGFIPEIYPPAKTALTGNFGGVTGIFSASGSYSFGTTLVRGPWTRIMMHAARTRLTTWKGSTNMRFIGSSADPSDFINWRPMFTRPGCNWELQAGERVHVVVQALGGAELGWPNLPMRALVTVGP